MIDMMPIVVQDDKIQIGAQFVPRYAKLLSSSLIIPAGTTYTLGAHERWDAIEISGVLKAPRDKGSTLEVIHIQTLPGGVRDYGNMTDMMSCDFTHEIVFRDVPLDKSIDPFQWGNGLLNLGGQDLSICCGRTEYTTALHDIKKDDTLVVISAAPDSWDIGDELAFPDTAPYSARMESRVFIKSIAGDGTLITLSKGLDFDHLRPRAPVVKDDSGNVIGDPLGEVAALVPVLNLTRNLIIRPENPNGTRGHIAHVGAMAMVNHQYTRFEDLGRTLNIALDDTSADGVTHIGTNPRGRYPEHFHHMEMAEGSWTVGNVYINHPTPTTAPGAFAGATGFVGTKWQHVTHNTHRMQHLRNICIGGAGAGFITEDGNETDNVYDSNFALNCIGNHDGTLDRANENAKLTNIGGQNPGGEGDGYFMVGVQNYYRHNEAWGCPIGFNVFNQGLGLTASTMYPGPDGIDVPFNQLTAIPREMNGNVTNCCTVAALEYWTTPLFDAVNHQSIYFGQVGLLLGTSNPAKISVINPDFVAAEARTYVVGISANVAYTQLVKINGGRVVGCGVGLFGGGKLGTVATGRPHFQNAINADFYDGPQSCDLDIEHAPLPGYPEQFIIHGRPAEQIWNGTLPTPPNFGVSLWRAQHGSRYLVRGWIDGKDHTLFNVSQLGSLPAYPAVFPPVKSVFDCPEMGLTMAQSWDKYGMSILGDVVRVEDAQTIRGLINGYGREGTDPTPLGPSWMIITIPNNRGGALLHKIDGDPRTLMFLYGVRTGQPTENRASLAQIDDGEPFIFDGEPSIENGDDVTQRVPAPAPGVHIVTTWRLNPDGTKIDISKRTFPILIGDGPPPPPPPPPPVNVPPTITLDMPVGGPWTAPATISLSAKAADSDGTIAAVKFYEGTTLIGVALNSQSPYTMTWTHVPSGLHGISAKATDNAGATTTSDIVLLTVNDTPPPPPNKPPTILLKSMTPGPFIEPANIALLATAFDPDGMIDSVSFYDGTNLIGLNAIGNPFGLAWSGVAAGTHIVTARAMDNSGAITISDPITVIVGSQPPPPPPDVWTTIATAQATVQKLGTQDKYRISVGDFNIDLDTAPK